jgi:hypothetical protein
MVHSRTFYSYSENQQGERGKQGWPRSWGTSYIKKTKGPRPALGAKSCPDRELSHQLRDGLFLCVELSGPCQKPASDTFSLQLLPNPEKQSSVVQTEKLRLNHGVWQ